MLLKKIISPLIVFTLFFLIGFISVFDFSPPVVSVVMPTYNRADLVQRAIRSVLSQTFEDFELIIVDDGSTDDTANVLQKFARLDKRIRLLKNDTNKGISYSRNKGQQAARGQYIFILDSDDQALPLTLERLINVMEKNPQLDAVSGGFYYEDTPDAIEQSLKTPAQNFSINLNPSQMRLCMLFTCCMRNTGAMIRASFVKKNRIRYDTHLMAAEDYDYWKQMLLNGGNLANVAEPLSIIRFHSTNAPRYYQEMENASLRIKQELFDSYLPGIKTYGDFTQITKCQYVEKLQTNFKEGGWLEKQDIDIYLQTECPPKGSTYVTLEHAYWKDFFIYEGDEGYLIKSKSKGKIKFDKMSLTIQWEKYPAEVFEKVVLNNGQTIYRQIKN